MMKLRTISTAVTILMVSLFTNLSAQNDIEDKCNIAKFQQVQISYDNMDLVTVEYLDALAEGPWQMKVRIYEESGKLLYTRILRKKGDSRIGYDISQLPTGNYSFELYKDRELVCSKAIVKQANIANEESTLNPNIAKFQQAQINYNSNDIVHVEYLDIFAEGRRKMTIHIYEESGELLYSKLLNKKGDVKVDFDISQFPDGNYTFELHEKSALVCSKLIVKQARMANANNESSVDGQENSTNGLLSEN